MTSSTSTRCCGRVATTDPTLLQLAERSDITFDRSVFADALAQAQLLDADDFARYGLVGEDLDGLRHRFALWRAELLDAAGPTR